jgi:hypothetical protein
VEQIQDGLKTDPVVSFIYGVNCEMKQIQDSLKVDPLITSLTRKLKMKQIQEWVKPDPAINFIVAGQTL